MLGLFLLEDELKEGVKKFGTFSFWSMFFRIFFFWYFGSQTGNREKEKLIAKTIQFFQGCCKVSMVEIQVSAKRWKALPPRYRLTPRWFTWEAIHPWVRLGSPSSSKEPFSGLICFGGRIQWINTSIPRRGCMVGGLANLAYGPREKGLGGQGRDWKVQCQSFQKWKEAKTGLQRRWQGDIYDKNIKHVIYMNI